MTRNKLFEIIGDSMFYDQITDETQNSIDWETCRTQHWTMAEYVVITIDETLRNVNTAMSPNAIY